MEKCIYERRREGESINFNSLLGSLSKKQLRMEIESKDRKQRNYNTFLTASTAVNFTVALLLGVGLVIFYAHFQATNIALEARIAAIEARELAAAGLEVASDINTGETTVMYFEEPHYGLIPCILNTHTSLHSA